MKGRIMRKVLGLVLIGLVGVASAQYTLAQKANVVSGNQIKFTAVVATDVATTVAPHGFATGDEVVIFTQSASPPAPLSVGSYYYAIVVNANDVKFATTPQNALAGTAIDITTTGSGLHAIAKNSANFKTAVKEALRLAASQILDGSLTLAIINASPIGTFSATQDQVNTFARRVLQSPDSYTETILPGVINQAAFQARGIYSLDSDIVTCVQNVIKTYSNL
jgi:hypothetical protein